MSSNMQQEQQAVFTVSQLNTLAKDILESSFPNILVEGEIADLSQPRSGHIYFSLKDDKSQIRCALFAGQKRLLKFQPQQGQQVLVKGRLSIFTPRGDFQLIANYMEEAGEGALRRAFELLKQKLASQGWFDEAHKQALPLFCKHVAVVTSPTGAAIRDILHVLKRRFPLMRVTIIPTLVQGKQASAQIVAAIARANALKAANAPDFDFDVLLLARGGGSLEDLWPFNEENVAEAIFHSQLPVISGVGHETDYTIADWVADVRAPTPSAAAETLSQDQAVIADYLADSLAKLKHSFRRQLQQKYQTLVYLAKANVDPRKRLQEQFQKLDFLEQRLHSHIKNRLARHQQYLHTCQAKLRGANPLQRIQGLKQKNEQAHQNLVKAMQGILREAQHALVLNSKRLHAISPLSTLERGFSISSVVSSEAALSVNKVVSSKKQVRVGDTLNTELQDGIIESTVTNIRDK